MIETILTRTKYAIGILYQPAIPGAYLGFYDILNDPMKFAGFLLLILQAILTIVKLYKETRNDKDKDRDSRNSVSD